MLVQAIKPDKDGKMSWSGDGFAKCLANFWSANYVNNKAAFDVVYESVGIEVKKQHHDPYKETGSRPRQLYVELSNGTSHAWSHIKDQAGCDLEQLKIAGKKDAALAERIGNGWISYCWDRWMCFRKPKTRGSVDLSASVFVIAQLFSREKKETCQIFTLPLNSFPVEGDVYWEFNKSGKALYGLDDKGRRRVEWYWKNNGQAKFYPYLDECLVRSPKFPTHVDRSDKFAEAASRHGVSAFIERLHKYNNLSPDFYVQAITACFQEDPSGFASHFKSLYTNSEIA
jgi:hypothetical protein